MHKHPILSNNNLWIVEGEDYGSYCDRFYVFPSNFADNVMGIVDYLDSKELNNLLKLIFKYAHNIIEFEIGDINTEYYYKLFFEHTGIAHKIRRSPRVHFLTSLENDHTNTFKAETPFKDGLFIKYITEFNKTIERTHCLNVPDYIE
jgi:hypothetical protein